MNPGIEFCLIEQCICAGCESVIARNNIAVKLDTDTSRGVQGRSVRAYCEHCDVAYGLDQVLRNGIWEPTGSLRILTGPAKLKLIRTISGARREIQAGVPASLVSSPLSVVKTGEALLAERIEQDATEPTREFSDCI